VVGAGEDKVAGTRPQPRKRYAREAGPKKSTSRGGCSGARKRNRKNGRRLKRVRRRGRLNGALANLRQKRKTGKTKSKTKTAVAGRLKPQWSSELSGKERGNDNGEKGAKKNRGRSKRKRSKRGKPKRGQMTKGEVPKKNDDWVGKRGTFDGQITPYGSRQGTVFKEDAGRSVEVGENCGPLELYGGGKQKKIEVNGRAPRGGGRGGGREAGGTKWQAAAQTGRTKIHRTLPARSGHQKKSTKPICHRLKLHDIFNETWGKERLGEHNTEPLSFD